MAHPKHITKRPRKRALKTVPAGRCRQRILKLSKHGVGRKAIHEHTGLDHRTLAKIRNGRTKYVLRETHELIFSVPFDGHCDKALVDARPTIRLINKLVTPGVGFTKAEIACRLNPVKRKKNRTASLQIGKQRVTAHTAMKVEKIYRQVMAV